MEREILQKMQSSYKLIIPQHVEGKIRTLLKEVHNIEWSGVLFYTYTGSFESDDLVLTCQDLIPMNIGSGAFTEFEVNEDVVTYMVSHDLLDCQMGLIHSHHSMATFFSETDVNTLCEEGKDRINFLSLIVNNEGTYSARITEKDSIHITRQIVATTKFFGDSQYSKETSDEMDTLGLRYHELEVCREEAVESDDQELLDRINKFKESHPHWNKPVHSENSSIMDRDDFFERFMSRDEHPKLFDDSEFFAEDKIVVLEPDQEKEAEQTLAKLITGNILVTKLPENMTKALPIINNMWKAAGKAHPYGTPDLVESITRALLLDIIGTEEYAQYCMQRLEKLFPEGSKQFYPYDELMQSLEELVYV